MIKLMIIEITFFGKTSDIMTYVNGTTPTEPVRMMVENDAIGIHL